MSVQWNQDPAPGLLERLLERRRVRRRLRESIAIIEDAGYEVSPLVYRQLLANARNPELWKS